MKYILMAILAMSAGYVCHGQHKMTAIVKDKSTKEPLVGVTCHISGTGIGNTTDIHGVVTISGVPEGAREVVFQYVGYETVKNQLVFPVNETDTLEVMLASNEEELEGITISSTRSSRTISDIPTRVEFIAGEELEEKGNMKPGDIRMLLAESTGIQTQQTSATSATASIRIQGLDGRYTQILKDGFPLYSGAASGLGLLQIPPLDLKQVEVIKGSSSTLYGGGAIAGMVNLISKTPTDERDLRFIVNGTSAGGLDVSGFYGKKTGNKGMTIYAASNTSRAYDPASIGLSAIPKFSRVTFNPKLFLYGSDKNVLVLGINATTEDRTGGDMNYLNGNTDSTQSYFERNKTQRMSTQFSLTHKFNDNSQMVMKNSYSYFDRKITIPGYEFNGVQNSTYSELNISTHNPVHELTGGLNLWTDGFAEKQLTSVPLRDYNMQIAGAFVQHVWQPTRKLIIEGGLRGDYVLKYGMALLPRLSVLYKIRGNLSTRFGAGAGYKPPTIFTEESERIQYKGVQSIDPETNKLERSYGANWDINYRTSIADGRVTFSVNHLFYYTRLNNPLVLQPLPGNLSRFVNITGHMDSKGTETNIKLGYKDFKLYLGYTFTDAYMHEQGVKRLNPLTPQHRLNSVLMYEVEEKWKLGLEAYYFSPQSRNDGSYGRDYWLMGFMAERIWEHFSLYINFENFLDVRQTRFESIYTGGISNPVFKDIYAPLDGFVINGGVKIRI